MSRELVFRYDEDEIKSSAANSMSRIFSKGGRLILKNERTICSPKMRSRNYMEFERKRITGTGFSHNITLSSSFVRSIHLSVYNGINAEETYIYSYSFIYRKKIDQIYLINNTMTQHKSNGIQKS